MAKTVKHEGYTIQSAPHHGAGGTKWQLRIFISFEDRRGVRTGEFSDKILLYATEQEADIHGITFGQRLIEGKVEGQSVTDWKGRASCWICRWADVASRVRSLWSRAFR